MANFNTKFEVACIIRLCEYEIIKDLEELGYLTDVKVDYEKHKEIITYKSGYYYPQEHIDIAEDEKHMWIDCGKNKTLFWLLTGIRHDTDYRKVFMRLSARKYMNPKWAVCMHESRPQYFKLDWKVAKPEEILWCYRTDDCSELDDIIQVDGDYNRKWRENIIKHGHEWGTEFVLK